MPFVRPSLSDIAARVEQDLVTRLELAGAMLRRAVVVVLARTLAGAAHLLHGHLAWIADQVMPDTAEAEYLERHASNFGLTRVAATFATGDVDLTGSDGSVIDAGVELRRADGTAYVTTESATIASGVATIAVEALVAGLAGNADVDTVLTFVSPIAGVTATGDVSTGGLIGGADEEDDEALRARLLAQMQSPPHGGSKADYIAWAKSVSGVTRVWVYPEELGAGTVTVRFVRDNDGTGSAIIPSGGEITAVQDAIDAMDARPVTANVTVVAPVAVPLNVEVSITPDTSATRAAVEAELADMIRRVQEEQKTAEATIPLSQVQLAIGIADGVTDYAITAPVADATHSTGQIAILGTVTFV